MIAFMAAFACVAFLLSRIIRWLVVRLWTHLRRSSAEKAKADHVIVDGSNVLFWRDGEPDLQAVREVVDRLIAAELVPGVMFDANAGYLVADYYWDDAEFALALDVSPERVLVVPKGEPADATILRAAREMGARVVSKDKFRDWADEYPEVERDGFLIKGGFRKGKVWLEGL